MENITISSAVDLRQNLVRSLVRTGRANQDIGPVRTKGNLVLAGTQQRTGPVKPTQPPVREIGSVSYISKMLDSDPDPLKNLTDPKHCLQD